MNLQLKYRVKVFIATKFKENNQRKDGDYATGYVTKVEGSEKTNVFLQKKK